jgi:hypothetical protein
MAVALGALRSYVAPVPDVDDSVAVTATFDPLWQPVQRLVWDGVADAVVAVSANAPAAASTSTAASSFLFKCDTSKYLERAAVRFAG